VKIVAKLVAFAVVGLLVLGLLLFVPAGTFDYWQAWLFIVVFVVSTWSPSVYLLRTNPAALQRRMRGGPTAEPRTLQKLIIAFSFFSLFAMVVVSVLDHRFGWSSVPATISVVGDILVAAGLGVAMLVVFQNSYAAATVQVEADQKLVSTGLYGLVRHPMYTGNVLMMLGIPLALGSYWGLVFVILGSIVLALRIRDEEKLLTQELAGYREYMQDVHYRLVPYVW
jgi:protein-S-isoprenylcysteine O-methyltransferase Ste14